MQTNMKDFSCSEFLKSSYLLLHRINLNKLKTATTASDYKQKIIYKRKDNINEIK